MIPEKRACSYAASNIRSAYSPGSIRAAVMRCGNRSQSLPMEEPGPAVGALLSPLSRLSGAVPVMLVLLLEVVLLVERKWELLLWGLGGSECKPAM